MIDLVSKVFVAGLFRLFIFGGLRLGGEVRDPYKGK